VRSSRRNARACTRACKSDLKWPDTGQEESRGSCMGCLDASYRGLAIRLKLGTQALN
jgi:hypothetical protein